MPEWNDLTDAEREMIIGAVRGDGYFDGQVACDVYRAIRRVMALRGFADAQRELELD